MPVGDDFYPYNFTFSEGEKTIGVALNGTFVREVLGCKGDRIALQKCVDEWHDVLAQEARLHRDDWFRGHRDGLGQGVDFICMLGLTGIPQGDQDRDYSVVRKAVRNRQGREQ